MYGKIKDVLIFVVLASILFFLIKNAKVPYSDYEYNATFKRDSLWHSIMSANMVDKVGDSKLNKESITTTTNSTYHYETKVIGDTQFIIKDKWIDVQGKIDTSGNVDINIKTIDTLDIIIYEKRKWFLGKRQLRVEVVNRNPNAKTIVNNFKVKKDGK